MSQREAQHGLDGLFADAGDLIPLLALNEVLLYHPGAAAGDDAVKAQVVHHILGVHAAGGHPAQVGVGAGQSLQLGHAAVLLGGEELHHVQTHAHGLLHLTRSGGAGHHDHALVQNVAGDLGVEAGADDKLRAGGNGTVGLLLSEHGAGAHQHVGHFGNNAADSFLGGSGAEGNLGSGQAALYQSTGQRYRFLSVVNGNDRNNANGEKALLQFGHKHFPLYFII